jgi:hypothetical protein
LRDNLSEQLNCQADRMVVNALLYARNLPLYVRRYCTVVALDALLKAAGAHAQAHRAWPNPNVPGSMVRRSTVTRLARQLYDLVAQEPQQGAGGQVQWQGLGDLPALQQHAARAELNSGLQLARAALAQRQLLPLSELAHRLQYPGEGDAPEAAAAAAYVCA